MVSGELNYNALMALDTRAMVGALFSFSIFSFSKFGFSIFNFSIFGFSIFGFSILIFKMAAFQYGTAAIANANTDDDDGG